ncbi:peptidase S24-like protein [Sphingobacterium spiritivorum ATCC 33300]|uniref:Peptidase S24-like protein n=1 Tax=Sphingobacterium spiritivorum ATCC 33300 TaxID=525372 RepID=C2G3M4_SPHSI|nr:XRE family transcriptional regulator [Sphingobacterium spiritivorum]EEI90229.1 peptidase S24-like protein [Sphingobacterium spiritivorum ATCC 33300]QQS95138.1 hypothetical protein I6J03_17410 [Sphingobacterium spiritivorum]
MIGNDLKIRLKNLGYELKEIAEKMGISPQALNSKFASDDLKVSFLQQIAKSINKSVYFLMEEPGPITNVIETKEEGVSRSEFLFRTDKLMHNQIIPLYDVHASASLITLFQQDRSTVVDYFSIPNMPKVDGAMAITGDSMYPILKSGDIIFFRKINNFMENLFFGEMYLLDISNDDDDYTTVKYVQTSDRGPDWIKIVSQNQHHSSKDIHLSWIKAAAFVKGSLRLNSMR